MWRDAAATEPNITAGLLEVLAGRLARAIAPEDLLAYIYGCLASPTYTELLAEALAEPGPRVPITASPERFSRMVDLGRELLRLHTYGERMQAAANWRLCGAARCVTAIPADDYPEGFKHADEVLYVGAGILAPVLEDVRAYEVSGHRVVRSWLGFRMRKPRGRKSSLLDTLRPERWTDAMTRELLELLWVIERSLAVHRDQGALFREILAGPLILSRDLPRPTAGQEAPPRPRAD